VPDLVRGGLPQAERPRLHSREGRVAASSCKGDCEGNAIGDDGPIMYIYTYTYKHCMYKMR
jgi:hypothetical protein